MSQLSPSVSAKDHMRGPMTAPVVLVEYGDYQCPFCAEFHDTMKMLLRAMGDNLCFVFRNFPLAEAHPYAEHAAEAAEEAGEMGKFWPMHDLLYENQQALDDASLLTYAKHLGLEQVKFKAALSGKHSARIREDFMGGVRSGVNGTPALFINGQRYDGMRDPESLAIAIQALAA
jgi:protein-disulfide isomerase